MEKRPVGDGALVDWFRRLHRELSELVERLRSAPSATVEEEAEGPPVTLGPSTAEIQERLRVILDNPPPGTRQAVEEARYALAAHADETLIHLDWSGSEAWRHRLLEAALFDTHQAGETIFERIDHLLVQGGRSGGGRQIAWIYLLMLSLGFMGKYRGVTDAPSVLASYRGHLYRLLTGAPPEPDPRRLTPDAYAHTLSPTGPLQRLPYLRRWVVVLAGVVTSWVLVGHLVWKHLIHDLLPLLDRILPS